MEIEGQRSKKEKMTYDRTTAPASDFITAAEAAFNVAGDPTYDATKLTRDIKASIRAAEHYCRRAFINQTWTYKMDKFPTVNKLNPTASIYVPFGKMQSLTDDIITYIDTDGTSVELEKDTDFYLDTSGHVARLYPIVSWPSAVSTTRPSPISFSAVMGEGSSLPDDMADVKDACLLWLGDMYELRQTRTPVQTYDTRLFHQLLHPYKIYFDFSINDL